jgi:hypothetical protein
MHIVKLIDLKKQKMSYNLEPKKYVVFSGSWITYKFRAEQIIADLTAFLIGFLNIDILYFTFLAR